MDNIEPNSEIVIYENPNKEIKIDIKLQEDTLWLSLNQIAILFNLDKSGISKHIKNIYKTGELDKKSTVAIFATVQKEGNRELKRYLEYYNLDLIISVGYRINSDKATKFRIWATQTLKNFLITGYALNEKRLIEVQNKFNELKTTISFIEENSKKSLLTGQESQLLHLLASYSKTLTILEAYDSKTLTTHKDATTEFLLSYETCLHIVTELKKNLISKNEASNLFGNERGGSFEGIIKGLYQTYDGIELYPNIGDKASNLLYLIIKDHPFSDGNKRTAAFLFVYFLDKTNTLYRKSGEKRINDNALIALALLIAESDPQEKDIMIKIIKNLITD